MSYLNSIKQSIILGKKNFLISTITILIIFLLGEIGSVCIVLFANGVDDYVSLGILFALMASLVLFAVISAAGFITDFENAIKMGKTRKVAATAILVNSLLNCYIVVGEILLLGFADNLFANAFIKLPYEIDFFKIILHPLILLAPLAVVALSASIGVALQKWGRPVFWVLWALWMFGCLGGPTLAENIANNDTSTLLGKFAVGASQAIKALPVNSFIVLGGIIFLGVVIFLILNIRKYSVKN